MKLLAAIILLIACVASLVSSSVVREKRQWGNPYGFRGPYGGYGPRPYNPYGYGGGPFRRGPTTVVQRTVIYRG
ncbi:unnamed protein product [Heligmosomoides polygyrus]|uniref:Uncharacterized protein n=1 Tax=Heligmosomoides polygyrus TaxID=6339 RepID=A0A183F5I1_HELPZ|nr:unnamed protein product [Heligmosomoides polygyrus]